MANREEAAKALMMGHTVRFRDEGAYLYLERNQIKTEYDCGYWQDMDINDFLNRAAKDGWEVKWLEPGIRVLPKYIRFELDDE